MKPIACSALILGLVVCTATPVAAHTPVVAQQPPAASAEVELVFWQSIADSTNPAEFEAYLRRFPNGMFSDLAQIRLEALRAGSNAGPVSADGRLAGGVAVPLSPEAMEAFLLEADLSNYRNINIGATGSQRATASDGGLTHDVHIQNVDQLRRVTAGEINFRDSYRYSVAAYRVAALLGLDNVPMSVRRTVRGLPTAVTWWIDDVAMNEGERIARRTLGPDPFATAQQFPTMYVFDELIGNVDRDQGAALWTSDWKLWLIDHARAFRLDVELSRPGLLNRVPADLLERLRSLTNARGAPGSSGGQPH